MFVTYERVVCFGFPQAEQWAKTISYKQRNRFFDRNPVGVAPPVVHIDFRVPAIKVPALMQLFSPLAADTSTARQALYPRIYPDGLECIPPEDIDTNSPTFIRWKEYCIRAEREYITFAKVIATKTAAEFLLPACLAHNVSVDVDVATLYRQIDRVFDRYAENQFKPLRPLFRVLLAEYYDQCDTLFGTLYDRFCVYKEEEEQEDTDESEDGTEGTGEEI